MKKTKKIIISVFRVILCLGIIMFWISLVPSMENRTWLLSYAQQAEAPYFVVAHNSDYDFSGDESDLYNFLYKFSKPVELTLQAKDGKLLLIDKTNGKTYEGTYKVTSNRFGGVRVFTKKSYTVVIDGLQGKANFSSNRTLFVSIGGYCLNFEIQ